MIMITGGMGFLGSSMAFLLCEAGREVLLTVHRQTEPASFLAPFREKSLFTAALDITDIDAIGRTVKEHGVKSIIHAASVYEAKGTLYDAMRVNVIGTINVLEAAVRAGIERVTALSSEESDRFIPATKKAEEHIASIYGAKCDIKPLMVRASRIYGPLFSSTKSPINAMLYAAVEGRPCDLPQIDEDEGHDNIYVRDCARGVLMLHLAENLTHRVYNLGMGRLSTYGEIRDAVVKVIPGARLSLGKNLGDVTPTKTPCDIDAPVDIGRIANDVGFAPEYDIERGISANIAWLREKRYV